MPERLGHITTRCRNKLRDPRLGLDQATNSSHLTARLAWAGSACAHVRPQIADDLQELVEPGNGFNRSTPRAAKPPEPTTCSFLSCDRGLAAAILAIDLRDSSLHVCTQVRAGEEMESLPQRSRSNPLAPIGCNELTELLRELRGS